MNKLLAITIIFFVSHSTNADASDLSAKKVKAGISKSVTFAILPKADGKIDKCRFTSVQDLKGRPLELKHQPSQAYIDSACTVSLAKGQNWIPATDAQGNIAEIQETCMWSKAIPDVAICRVGVQADFAEEIPLGAGYSAVFELTADSKGQLASCKFDSLSTLSREPKVLDLKPHDLFVADACRKLSSVAWRSGATESSPSKEFYMYCRYIAENPVRAFCDQKFGK